MNTTALAIAAFATLCSCMFATCYGSLRAYSRTRMNDLLEERGQLDRLEPFLARSSKLLLLTSMLRTTFNLILLLATLVVLDDIETDWLKYTLAFALTGGVVSVFGVAIPTSLARYQPERVLVRAMPLLNVLLTVFMPLANLLNALDPIVRRLSGVDQETTTADERLAEEILSVVDEHTPTATVNEEQKDMLEGVIELRSTTAGQIMTPRTDVEGLEIGASLDEVKNAILTLGHSRIPVYQESLDHIVGVLYAKDLIRYLGDGQMWDMRSVLREAYMVPESKLVSELLTDLKVRKVHIAIVLDEYGGTAGLVTIEDILEEIVGEIQDEYEAVEAPKQILRVDERTIEVDARVHVDEVNDELDLQLPEDDAYDTIGGLVFAQLGHIPDAGESFTVENVKVTVLEVERTKVNRVRLEVLESEPTPVGGA